MFDFICSAAYVDLCEHRIAENQRFMADIVYILNRLLKGFKMLSNKSYLVRAFYDWIVDSACTPYVVINALYPRTKVPTQFIDQNNQITLNASPDAVRDLKISNDFIEFRASFSGIVHFISAPIKSVLAVYAQENGEGMFFDFEEETSQGGWEGSPQDLKLPKTETAQVIPDETKKKLPSYLKIVD